MRRRCTGFPFTSTALAPMFRGDTFKVRLACRTLATLVGHHRRTAGVAGHSDRFWCSSRGRGGHRSRSRCGSHAVACGRRCHIAGLGRLHRGHRIGRRRCGSFGSHLGDGSGADQQGSGKGKHLHHRSPSVAAQRACARNGSMSEGVKSILVSPRERCRSAGLHFVQRPA